MKQRFFAFCLALYALSVLFAASALGEAVISEVCSANKCILFDEAGDTPDWVELYNPGAQRLALDGYALSDRADGQNAFLLDGAALEPGEYRAFCLPKAGFALSSAGETLYLLRDGAVIARLPFPALGDNAAYALTADGSYQPTFLPTPGSANRALGENEAFVPAEGVRLTEFMASAAPYQATAGYDWLEIGNTGERKVNLKGYAVRLGMAGSKEYVFDEEYLSSGYYIGLYCCTDALEARSTGFKLPAEGAVISLWNPAGELIDFVRLGAQYANISCGRALGENTLSYFADATFGRKNRMAYAGRAQAPALSLQAGRYTGSVTISIDVPEGTTVRYTLNGNAPTQKSDVYAGPLTFTETTALTAAAFQEGLLPSETRCATYVLDLDLDTPVVCLIVDRAYLFSDSKGILSRGEGAKPNYQQNWEYPAVFEYLSESGALVLSQRCGIGVQGNSSRSNLQKSFQLAARKAYGAGAFDFNPFPNRDFAGYKSLNLRAAGSEGNTSTRFRDAYLTSLAAGTHLLYADAQPVLVYLNGALWGQYNLRERINKHFIAQHTGVTGEAEDAIDLLSETGAVVHNGSAADYTALSRFMKNNDLNAPENLDYALSQMDVDSYFDYVCFMLITGNRDLSNTRFYRVPGGKWTWLLCDLDRALEKADNISAFWLYTLEPGHKLEYMTDHVPFAALMRVPAMREKFLARLGELLAEKFTPQKLLAGIDAWSARLAPLIPYHMARWDLASVRYWEREVDELRAVAQARPALVVQYAQKYFSMTEEETARFFGAFLASQQ